MSALVKREANVLKTHITSELVQNQESVNRHFTSELGAKEVSLKSHVTASTTDVGSSLSAQMSTLDVQSSKERARDRFIGSLKFPGMNARKNQIAENYPNTCFWFLDLDGEDDDTVDHPPVRNGSAKPRWDNFLDWLESDSKLYWVSGKPGSGKSTLMKFLTSRPETKNALQRWRPEVQILSHYLWSPGTIMGRHVKGVWCSLLYQLFVDSDDLIDWILAGQPHLRLKESDSDWNIVELTRIAKISMSFSRRALCIFIDGLDEICRKGGPDSILGLVDELRMEPHIKICVSSRPEPTFQGQLSTYPHVNIHEVTSSDIKRVCEGILCKSYFPGKEIYRHRNLINKLVERAEGVFLWALLVAKSLLRGLKNHDTHSELYARLHAMPSGLAELYYHMWSKLPEDDRQVYQEKAALYFNLAVNMDDDGTGVYLTCHHDNYSVLEMMLASNDRIQHRFMTIDNDIPVDTWKQNCDTVIKDIEICCAGLLEIRMEGMVDWERQARQEHYETLIAYSARSITFIHRTVYDFFTSTEEGKKIIFSPTCTKVDIIMRQFKAALILCLVCEVQGWSEEPDVGNKSTAASPAPNKWSLGTYLACLYQVQPFLPLDCINELITGCHSAWLRDLIWQMEESPRMQDDTTRYLIDFMTYVARYGIRDAVKAHLNTYELDMISITTYLHASCSLRCTNLHAGPRGHAQEYLQTIRYLLRRGADPNAKIPYLFADHKEYFEDWPRNYNKTVSAFSVFLCSILTEEGCQRRGRRPKSPFRKILQLFLKHGADLGSRSPITVYLSPARGPHIVSIDHILVSDNDKNIWELPFLVLEIKNSLIVEIIYNMLRNGDMWHLSTVNSQDIRVVAFSESSQTPERRVFYEVESTEDSAELLEMLKPLNNQPVPNSAIDHVRIGNIKHRSPMIQNLPEYFRELGWCVPSDRFPVSVEDCSSSGEP